MNFRSHTIEELRQARAQGETVWCLDTDGDGEDDHLIGDYDEVLGDILSFHGLAELPEHWRLTSVDWDID